MTRNRTVVLAAVGLLTFVFALLGNNVLRELRSLSTAETDNLQWTILQVETEIANLHVALAEARMQATPDEQVVRLRADIALSRLGIIGHGQTADLFSEDAIAQTLIAQLQSYSANLITVLDRAPDLNRDDLSQMLGATQDIRPDARRLVLLALEAGIDSATERRTQFARLLAQTGATAIALILGLATLLFVLDRLLARVSLRDRALKTSSARLLSTVAASLDAIVTANEAGEIVEFNSSAERIFGWSREEVMGLKMEHTIIPSHHRAGHVDGMARYLAKGAPRVVDKGRVELTALRKTGEEFPIELNITSVQSDGGMLFIAYLRDISAEKINEQQLIDARDRAENMDRAKSQFLAIMSHEMRTPLNGILGVLDLLRTSKLNDQQQHYIRVAAASSEILLEQVNEALDITRIEMGSMTLSPHPFAMVPSIERVVDVLSPLAQEKGLSLQLDMDQGMDRSFFGDDARIGQILTNLLGNAIKFTDSGSVTVKVTGIHGPKATEATIAVRDTGGGIPKDRLEDIFEDFVVLAHSVGRQNRGDGLGLSISRKVARLMGGDLTVQSTTDVGSVFALTLPLPRDQTDSVADDPNTPTAQLRAHSVRKDILIVEDNAINRSVLRDMLESLGHVVTEAKNGQSGVQVAQAQAFDLILMDISMPVMDGIEAIGHIRRDAGPNQHAHVVGLTAHGREEYRDRAAAAGMDDFFTKPIRLATLRSLVDGPPKAVVLQQTGKGDIDRAVLDDLIAALGPEKLDATTMRFFTELTETLDLLNVGTSGSTDAAASLHKLRGAAALLGLTGIVDRIDQANPDALEAKTFNAIRQAADAAKTQLHDLAEKYDPIG
jgi:PAS domain S-box-containing protein